MTATTLSASSARVLGTDEATVCTAFTVLAINGALHAAQRFAIDRVRLDRAGRLVNGDPSDVRSYSSYGADILAVAGATVVSTRNTLDDQVPGQLPDPSTITLRTILGNSGNTSAPRLHFQVTEGGSVLGSSGLPFVVDRLGLQLTAPKHPAHAPDYAPAEGHSLTATTRRSKPDADRIRRARPHGGQHGDAHQARFRP